MGKIITRIRQREAAARARTGARTLPAYGWQNYDSSGLRTGWPPGLLQDDDRKLSRWLANRGQARALADDAAQEAAVQRLTDTGQEIGGWDEPAIVQQTLKGAD